MRHRLDIVFATLPLLALSACDAQVDPDYPGEPIASLVGTVTNEMQVRKPTNAEVALVWLNTAGSPDRYFGERAAVNSQFPADFTLDVYAPPPAEALNDYTHGAVRPQESRVGVAYIAAVDAQIFALYGDRLTDAEDGMLEQLTLGGAENHMLVYVEKDVQPNTHAETLLGGQLAAGYHVMDVKRPTEAQKQQAEQCFTQATNTEEFAACYALVFDRLQLAPVDMQTRISVRLVDDSETINWPDWT
jgi:hypothetical protein